MRSDLRNCEVIKKSDLPIISNEDFERVVIKETDSGLRISAMFGLPSSGGSVMIYAVLSEDKTGILSAFGTSVKGSYDSITPKCSQAHIFEREIFEQTGAEPKGHPWLKPVRKREGYKYYELSGEGVHEVAVGPVHAGVIEPGHFRFQCHGEEVFNLEIHLGYQHRGVEKGIVGGPDRRTIHYMETVAGDTSIGHSTAYCHAVESLANCRVPLRAQMIRGVALELERIANHAGDLGALAGDVGYLPTSSYCGRLRGDFLNLQARICGSRFGRGLLRPGGVLFDLSSSEISAILKSLDAHMRDLESAAQLLWDSPSVLARFDDTGHLPKELCRALGIVGPAARAAGIAMDVRSDFPVGIFRFAHLPLSTWHRGDVFARAYVRWLEIVKSAQFIRNQLESLAEGDVKSDLGPLIPDSFVVSMVEGWRGEICHVAGTGKDGKIAFYKIVDPSFHNWSGLEMALRNGQISDFPLINKSFNLSYCGYDL
ncbi:MAG TPA: hydrogenase [bacterium]|nr:hydrogenase [Myxococcales bacterium]OQA60509.1 MAG: Formate hydrogenlyase subunit 5 precursor [bacterium ADurb.Bin270]HPW45549.1 hydrogenase [bacterium]HQC50732.1 hydrogenase [bacterium]